MINGKRILAVIPARGGSVRFPNKNLALLDGKPLVCWAVEAALAYKKDGWVDNIYVTSDSDAVLAAISKYPIGYERRPAALAKGEPGSSVRTWQNLWNWVQDNTGPYDYSILLEPTCPLRTSSNVFDCIREAMLDRKYAHIVGTISQLPDRFRTAKLLLADNEISFIEPLSNYQVDLTTFDSNFVAYFNGACYAAAAPAILNMESPQLNCGVLCTNKLVNIDYPEDLEEAEMILHYCGFDLGRWQHHDSSN